MFGEHMGKLSLFVEDRQFGGKYTNFTRSGDQGRDWLHAEVDILLTSPTQVVSVHIRNSPCGTIYMNSWFDWCIIILTDWMGSG